MRRIPPRTTDGLRVAAAAAGIAAIVIGTYDSRWIPVLGCLAVIALSVTEFALARLRRWIADAESRSERQLAQVTARQGGRGREAGSAAQYGGPGDRSVPSRRLGPATGATTPVFAAGPDLPADRGTAPGATPEPVSDGLLRLLEAVHQELNLANEETARAKAELAELTREWNALVQESVCRQLGFCGPPGPDRPSPRGRPWPPGRPAPRPPRPGTDL
ncbi:hypothetical protein GCM10010495_53490 [Kitasatospora herbaricolor]|uniref:hypothetical protein n=1 Tax=Kitasatospora herbaricolor TaxID=68217 RepID=UPI0017485A68|nr:hypothetical protein [Kitasatospora herbaricolor]MDQ0307379.1 hypothetical protein [Kitasatospora herbaricolor]GGV30440.1 hypothetical protein GCM10010495_53490 [Kitasatospora herbaricolor]